MCLETWQVEHNFLIPKLYEGKAQVLQETSKGLESDYYLLFTTLIDAHLPPSSFFGKQTVQCTLRSAVRSKTESSQLSAHPLHLLTTRLTE